MADVWFPSKQTPPKKGYPQKRDIQLLKFDAIHSSTVHNTQLQCVRHLDPTLQPARIYRVNLSQQSVQALQSVVLLLEAGIPECGGFSISWLSCSFESTADLASIGYFYCPDRVSSRKWENLFDLENAAGHFVSGYWPGLGRQEGTGGFLFVKHVCL